jgi:RNA polymerase sigma factor (sigma-70 family)
VTELNDGYGDDLTPSEVISQYERWLHAVANRLLPPGDHRHDDLVQEGRIGMWKALAKYDSSKGALPSYLTRGAEMQIRNAFLRGENWTGSPSRRGYSGPAQISKVISLDAALDDSSVHNETAGGVTDDHADSAALARHRDEIAAAIASLTEQQQRYVALRFIHGLTNAQATRMIGGVSEGTLWHAPRSGAKHKLRAHLSHLDAA